MSFTLSVFANEVPENLKDRWQRSLAEYGLRVEFFREFDAKKWQGGTLPVKLEVESGAFRAAGRYGKSPLLAAFEFYIDDVEANELEWLSQDPQMSSSIEERLGVTKKHFFFITSMGRTAADLRVQYFAAATLAILSNGVLVDGQSGRYLVGDEAIAAASEEADRFDSHEMGFRDWDSIAFPGWESLCPDKPVT